MIEQIKNFFLPRHNVAEIIKPAPKQDSWKAYAGDFPLPLRASKTDPDADDNILLPIVGEIIDASTTHLLGDGVDLDIQGDGQEAAQEWLDAFLKRSKIKTTVQKLALNAAVCGHGFVKLLVKDGVPDRFQVVNSAMMNVESDPRDTELALSYTISWETTDPKNKTVKHQEITKRDLNGFWNISEYESQGNGRMALVSSTDWPFEFAPIFDCQNLTNPTAYWGKSDCPRAAINQNESINTTLSMLARLLRNHSHPKSILTGLNSRKTDWISNEVLSLPEGVTATQLEMSADGAESLISLYKELSDALHTNTRTPLIASGKLENTGAMSGAALKILWMPLDAKTSEKRGHLGSMLENLCERALELAGFAGCDVTCVFPNTTPTNALEDRQVAQIDKTLGVSSETVLRGLGFDPTFEAEQVAEGTALLPPAPEIDPAPIGFRRP